MAESSNDKSNKAQNSSKLARKHTEDIDQSSMTSKQQPRKSKKQGQPNNLNKSSITVVKNAMINVIEEAASSPSKRRKGDSSSKSPKDAARRLRALQTTYVTGPLMKPLTANTSEFDLGTTSNCEIQRDDQNQDLTAEGIDDCDKDEKKGSDQDSDVESMLREMDPVKRHIKQLKLKTKQTELNRPKPLPKLSYEKRGWNAPRDQPYVPVGRMTELVTAFEKVRQNLPNTGNRFKKQTYRQMLVIKKRERDLVDKRRNLRVSSADASARKGKKKKGASSRSQSSIHDDGQKMEDTSRVVMNILPKEKDTLVQIRDYAYDQMLKEMHKRRQSAPTGPKLNKFGRIAAGYVQKKNEKRDEIELQRQRKETLRLTSANSSVLRAQAKANENSGETGELDENGQPVIKSDIELQMEKEKSRHWIRKRNGKIYDEKIKNMILTTDNGSTLLKQEIQESEGRLAAVKLGRPLDEVVPRHPPDYFLTDKEDYFLGEKRVLRRQEKEAWIASQQEQEEHEEREEPKVVELGKEFQTIGSNQDGAVNDQGGFFLTEQPITVAEAKVERSGIVRIPDLLESKPVQSELSEEPVRVSQMFQSAQDEAFEKVYRATTSHVKGLYLGRLKSRESGLMYTSMQGHEAYSGSQNVDKNGGLKHQRANSFSTAAATTNVFYRSGKNIRGGQPHGRSGHRSSEVASGTLNQSTNLDSERVLSAMTSLSKRRPHGSGHYGHQRGKSHFLHASEQNILLNLQEDDAGNKTMSALESAPQLNGQRDGRHPMSQQDLINLQENNYPSRSHVAGSRSALTANGAKRLLKDAKSKRTHSMNNALKVDLSNRTNRVRFLQNLQKERIAKKKLDQAQGSNIFQGFSNEEIHEILIEMPQLKKMQKEKDLQAMMGPQQPQFSNAQLIHLDCLNDIANRGQAELRLCVMNQINDRRSRVHREINQADVKYDMNDPSFLENNSAYINSNQAILKQFQKNSKEGYEENIPANYNWSHSLKERLNFADARQQQQLYQAFKEEDFVHKIWDENGPDHKAMDSERNHNQTGGSQKTLSNKQKGPTLMDQIGQMFNEQQAQIDRQSTQNFSQPQLRKMQTQWSNGLLQQNQGSTEAQKQVEDEMREYDHSDQAILMKLIEVYEKRKNRKNGGDSQQGTRNNKTTASGVNNMGSKHGSSQHLKRQGSKSITVKLNQKSSIAVISQEQTEDNNIGDRQSTNGNEATASNATLGFPPKLPIKMLRKGTKLADKDDAKSVSINSLPMPALPQKKSSNQDLNSTRQQQQAPSSQVSAAAAKPPRGGQQMLGQAVQQNKKKSLQIKKDYRKFVIEHIQKEYWRAFDALVSATDLEMELVIHGFNNSVFYREAKEFLVTRGKFMSEDHLIQLKEDPKTILSLYRIFMLHFKTTQVGVLEKKLQVRKKKTASQANLPPMLQAASMEAQGAQFDEFEESDYSDSDFQDLMSNKQIEENIRVFFDRMHELVNPIDQQRLKLDSVQQIKATVKTFYKRKAEVSDKLLQELDQMSAERPVMIKVKQGQFNDPEDNNQANLHAAGNDAKLPATQQCRTRMTDIRLNSELHRLRQYKQVAQKTASWYNELATIVLAEQIQDEPLVLYMLDQIKHVIEIGEVFTRSCFHKLMATFDPQDAAKPEVIKIRQFLDELLPMEEDTLAFDQTSQQQCQDNENSAMEDGSRMHHKISFSDGIQQQSNMQHSQMLAHGKTGKPHPSKVTFEVVH